MRAAQTIELASADTHLNVPLEWDRRIYLASSATLADVLREQPDSVDRVLMVGHNPGLEDLIFDLVPDAGQSPLRRLVEEKFPTATFAVMELAINQWCDLEDGCGSLVHLVRPRDLDAQLGPQLVED